METNCSILRLLTSLRLRRSDGWQKEGSLTVLLLPSVPSLFVVLPSVSPFVLMLASKISVVAPTRHRLAR